jgi:hypothetical protein
MQIGGLLSSMNIDDENDVILPFEGYVIDIVIRHLERIVNVAIDTGNNDNDTTDNDTTLNELKHLSFESLFKILQFSDYLCLDSLIVVIMKIIAKATLELTPAECAETLLNKPFDSLDEDEKLLLTKICIG